MSPICVRGSCTNTPTECNPTLPHRTAINTKSKWSKCSIHQFQNGKRLRRKERKANRKYCSTNLWFVVGEKNRHWITSWSLQISINLVFFFFFKKIVKNKKQTTKKDHQEPELLLRKQNIDMKTKTFLLHFKILSYGKYFWPRSVNQTNALTFHDRCEKKTPILLSLTKANQFATLLFVCFWRNTSLWQSRTRLKKNNY